MKNMKRTNDKYLPVVLTVLLLGGLVLCALVGMIISKQMISEEIGSIGARILTEALLMTCALIIARRQSQKRLLMALIVAVVYMALRLLVGTIFFSQQEIKMAACFLTLGAGVCAGILSVQKKQRRR